MEIEYHKKKIKKELLDLDFSAWTKESIITLVSVFQYSQCKELYTISLMVLDDYLKWYKNNKDKHLNNLKEKKKCECGDLVSYSNRVRHLKTSKHLKRSSIVNTENNENKKIKF